MSYIDYYDTPIGTLEVCANNYGVKSITFVDHRDKEVKKHDITSLCIAQLDDYFHNKRSEFSVPLAQSGTSFQESVWAHLSAIPFGQTVAYADIANAINNPKAVRAVGAANGKNAIPIIVPCHRVIGRDGSLTGFASGTERKAWLLKHEGITLL